MKSTRFYHEICWISWNLKSGGFHDEIWWISPIGTTTWNPADCFHGTTKCKISSGFHDEIRWICQMSQGPMVLFYLLLPRGRCSCRSLYWKLCPTSRKKTRLNLYLLLSKTDGRHVTLIKDLHRPSSQSRSLHVWHKSLAHIWLRKWVLASCEVPYSHFW